MRIDAADLARVCGGAAACTVANPTGAPPQQYMSAMRNPDGSPVSTPEQYRQATMSPLERANEAVDRAMKPWEMFNDLFGGFAAGGTETVYPRRGR